MEGGDDRALLRSYWKNKTLVILPQLATLQSNCGDIRLIFYQRQLIFAEIFLHIAMIYSSHVFGWKGTQLDCSYCPVFLSLYSHGWVQGLKADSLAHGGLCGCGYLCSCLEWFSMGHSNASVLQSYCASLFFPKCKHILTNWSQILKI